MPDVRRQRLNSLVKPTSLSSYWVDIAGPLLERGFWLYAIRIAAPSRVVLYVGRTGDTSSPFAGSPLSRLSSHFSLRPNSRANALVRNLRKLDIDPSECQFRFFALGPLHSQQASMASHLPLRDLMAGLEAAVAHDLSHRGYAVLGSHPRVRPVPPATLEHVLAVFALAFPTADNVAGA